MDDAVAAAREARTLLERLGARVPGFTGYLERELRREVDQLLRADLAGRLDAARAGVAAFSRTLRLGAAERLARLAALDRSLDGAANALRHAGSGFGGMFDAVKVREEQLEALYRFDLDLVERVDAVRAASSALGADEEAVARLEQAVAAVSAALAGRERAVVGAFGERTRERGER
ncbi:MAG: hypothetical protein PHQ91_04005 [Thermoanaerobaculaceae bacterium]|nr:hypothetical protein [Thermoanaerobaculaceae bacterium]TAM49004.1 MAG: hypothetical protein EPN53_08775 [Acidobacteriota bacterium]